jgi:predicted phosphate transport protein (TIGR00153 family)
MAFLRKALSRGTREQQVVENIRTHVKLLCTACETFKCALEESNRSLMRDVIDLEREGDSIRREIISKVHDGAFLPYIRPDLCKFVEVVDGVFDLLEDTALFYLDAKLPENIREDCARVALLNQRICEMLLLTFEAMLKGEDLSEKTLAVRIYEKKVDDIKFDLFRDVRETRIDSFWEGKVLADFLSGLTTISDIIEDASDYVQIIHMAMR